ncbi:hypothetical protein [Adhaeretor mobilis]|uniref:Uncharacterized protein n=1 Tax=Adhaeretor mobilis TaxID=1930276 RepID=A0A517MWS7_9BACT|nr:hypothetical protein [Adhaeretor mobilis]QDS99328.1 hypothetical protein HG15A2_26500 [Adhaeretor mobilis]
MNPIEAGKEALEAIVLPLREEKQQLTKRITEIDITLKPLEAAINPLDGRGRGGRKAKPKPTKRTANQEDVRQVLVKLATDHPGVKQERLLEKAKQMLKEQHGLDLKGFANRCREVLGSEPFEIDEAGSVRLAAAPKASSEPLEAILLASEPKTAVDNFASGVLGG